MKLLSLNITTQEFEAKPVAHKTLIWRNNAYCEASNISDKMIEEGLSVIPDNEFLGSVKTIAEDSVTLATSSCVYPWSTANCAVSNRNSGLKVRLVFLLIFDT